MLRPRPQVGSPPANQRRFRSARKPLGSHHPQGGVERSTSPQEMDAPAKSRSSCSVRRDHASIVGCISPHVSTSPLGDGRCSCAALAPCPPLAGSRSPTRMKTRTEPSSGSPPLEVCAWPWTSPPNEASWRCMRACASTSRSPWRGGSPSTAFPQIGGSQGRWGAAPPLLRRFQDRPTQMRSLHGWHRLLGASSPRPRPVPGARSSGPRWFHPMAGSSFLRSLPVPTSPGACWPMRHAASNPRRGTRPKSLSGVSTNVSNPFRSLCAVERRRRFAVAYSRRPGSVAVSISLGSTLPRSTGGSGCRRSSRSSVVDAR